MFDPGPGSFCFFLILSLVLLTSSACFGLWPWSVAVLLEPLEKGKVFGRFWGPEIRKGLWRVFGFRNSEGSLGGFGVPKFRKVFG